MTTSIAGGLDNRLRPAAEIRGIQVGIGVAQFGNPDHSLGANANDSASILDDRAGATLATNRAILRDEQQPTGAFEKFKPYPLPETAILEGPLK